MSLLRDKRFEREERIIKNSDILKGLVDIRVTIDTMRTLIELGLLEVKIDESFFKGQDLMAYNNIFLNKENFNTSMRVLTEPVEDTDYNKRKKKS